MQYNFKVSCQKNRLVEIRNFLNDVLHKHVHSETDIHSMVLAVDEVCANLMIHSHQCDPNENLELNVRVNDRNIVFEIKDKGRGFNIKNYKEPTLQEIVTEKKKGGLGLILVKRIMDKIEFKKRKDCNVYKLYKRCKPNHT